jgi:Tol biopolymer transport system component
VSRKGVAGGPLTAPGLYRGTILAPDGRRVALTENAPDQQADVWVLDLQRGTRTPITSGGADDFNPLFTADGRRVVFESERPVYDLYIRPADGSAPASPLVTSSYDKYPGSVTPDGRTLLFDHNVLPHRQIWSVPLGDSGAARPLLVSEAAGVRTARVAPNGRWLAYVSTETGGPEVYLSPFPDVRSARSQVSVRGGDQPRWTRGGRELVYRSADRMMAVAVDPVSGRLSAPVELFHGDFLPDSHDEGFANWDVTPDGERFLMLKPTPGTEPRQVVLVTNWVRQLARALGR